MSANQMLKEIQEKIHKEKEKSNGETSFGEEKKRTYEKAFEDEEVSITANGAEKTKKLRSSDSEEIETDEILCEESNSINDASEALSDEESVVQPKQSNNLIDDEILIEDSLSEANGKQGLSNGNENTNDGSDGDVIECSSEDEDIIELNDDEEDINESLSGGNANTNTCSNDTWTAVQSSVNYKKMKLLTETAVMYQKSDANNGHFKNGHDNSANGDDNNDDIQVLE